MTEAPPWRRTAGPILLYSALLLLALLGLDWFLAARGIGLWVRDILLSCLFLILWLARKWLPAFTAAMGLLVWLLTARAPLPWAVGLRMAGLGLAFAATYVLWRRRQNPIPLVPRPAVRPMRILLALGVLGTVLLSFLGPVRTLVNPQRRREFLRAKAQNPLPPERRDLLAVRLRDHVEFLSGTLGERTIYQRSILNQARDYVKDQFSRQGIPTTLRGYDLSGYGERMGREVHNVEALLRPAISKDAPPWVIGAHYDSAPGTPGADDNASGVAVLIELARLLKARGVPQEIRLVAFTAEEPPSFGTRNMGSYHYARHLRKEGVSLAGMISLEMVGYYTDRGGSQLYPPFLSRWHPDRGDFIALVGNRPSRRLVSDLQQRWKTASSFPLETTLLPGPFAGMALSDQLNFWDLGFSAVMLSDTSFYRNPHYHEPTDLPETLDFNRMAEITRALERVFSGEPPGKD